MLIDRHTADFLTKAIRALDLGKTEIPVTNRCPECGETVDTYLEAASAIDGHIVYRTTADTYVILIGCEGYWCVNPELIGLPRGMWQDYQDNPLGDELQPVNDKGYPACPAATRENPHYLCFMERRDLDNCPECGHPIPEDLKLDNDMNAPEAVLPIRDPDEDEDTTDMFCSVCGREGCVVDHTPVCVLESDPNT
jgi:hypothetical protein